MAIKLKAPQGGWRKVKMGVIGISVGQPYCAGSNVESLVAFAKDNFESQQILLTDTLQRWNIQISGVTRPKAYKQAKDAGDAWLARHNAVINGVPVVRWDAYKAPTSFKTVLAEIYGLMQTDMRFRGIVQNQTADYVRRHSQRGAVMGPKARHFSMCYILEELAADCAAAVTPRAVIYPYSEPKAYRALRWTTSSIEAPLSRLHWCHARLE